MTKQLDPWKDAAAPLKQGEEYLNRTEKLLYRRLWEYLIGENWEGVGQVVQYLGKLHLI